MTLRDYQRDMIDRIPGQGNTMLCLPTGAGKTYTFTTYVKEQNVPTSVIAHRSELVGQMSLALAEADIPHQLIASDAVINDIRKAHRRVLGRTLYDPSASTICASVDTLLRRDNTKLFGSIRQWIIDEGHHVLEGNKWGRVVEKFPNARGLGVTATPMRADGKGLSRETHGVFDHLIEGPTGDDLIDMGYLSPYQLIGPPLSGHEWDELELGTTGDYKRNQLSATTKSSQQLTGDVVQTYLTRAAGKLGIVFCVDIEHAEDVTQRFVDAGVRAALVTGKTPFLERVTVMEKFRNRQLDVLVNVDLFGEGVDVPAVEVVIMARKTASFPLYSQQFGRALRPVYHPDMPLHTDDQRRAAIAAGPKPHALIIDHVENWRMHLLPTGPRRWPFDGGEKRSNGGVKDEFKLKACRNPTCNKPYRAILDGCPYCGHVPQRTPRQGARPVETDGDLDLIDVDLLRELQNRANAVVGPVRVPGHLSRKASLSLMKKHHERGEAQKALRDAIATWAGWKKHLEGLSVTEIQRSFYLNFKTDVLTAQTLGAREANDLRQEIEDAIRVFERSHGAGHRAGGVLPDNERHPVAQ